MGFAHYCYRPLTKLGEGNVFTGVCQGWAGISGPVSFRGRVTRSIQGDGYVKGVDTHPSPDMGPGRRRVLTQHTDI